MSIVSDIIAAGLSMGLSVTAESVQYTTVTGLVKTLPAAPRKPRGANRMVRAAALDVTKQDWIIAVSDLKFGDEQWEPREGDQIKWRKMRRDLTFEVVPLEGQSPEEIRDSGRSQYRVHTQLIKDEPA